MDTPTLADFSECLQHPFRVTATGISAELILTGATPSLGGRPGGRQPFSLTFSGPAQPRLAQGTYDFEHPVLGLLDIFIVPIAADASSSTYEAVFS